MKNTSQFIVVTLFLVFITGCLSLGYDFKGIANNKKFPYKASIDKVAQYEKTFSELNINSNYSDFLKAIGDPDLELFGSDEYFKAKEIYRTYIYYIENTKTTNHSYRIYIDKKSQILGIIKLKR